MASELALDWICFLHFLVWLPWWAREGGCLIVMTWQLKQCAKEKELA